MKRKRKGFLICPVRSGKYKGEAEAWVKMLEDEGVEIHYPPRDTDQTDDGIGLQICADNLTAIRNADAAYIIYDEDSKGSHFDLGMAFALNKPIYLINVDDPTPRKSFFNVLLALLEG